MSPNAEPVGAATRLQASVKDDPRVRDERVLVYSTDGSLPLPKPGPARRPQPSRGAVPDDGVVRVARERRRNSAVTLVHGLAAAELDAIGKDLRRVCGTGGTAKNGVVELQGDHRDKVVAYFEKAQRRVKRAGGECRTARFRCRL
jgi:translation initiation factor 1